MYKNCSKIRGSKFTCPGRDLKTAFLNNLLFVNNMGKILCCNMVERINNFDNEKPVPKVGIIQTGKI